MEASVVGDARGVIAQHQEFFDNADATLGLSRRVQRYIDQGTTIDGKGRAVVSLPKPDLVGPYDNVLGDDVTSIDDMVEQIIAADAETYGETYGGIPQCMKRQVHGPRRSQSSGRKKSRPKQPGYSAQSSLRAAEQLASLPDGPRRGRPRKSADEKRVTVTLRVTPITAALLKKKKRKAGRFVDEACGAIAA